MADQEMEVPEIEFGNNELTALLLESRAGNNDEGIVTCPEVARALGRSPEWVRRKMRELLLAGRVEVGSKKQKNIIGTVTTVRGFKLVQK